MGLPDSGGRLLLPRGRHESRCNHVYIVGWGTVMWKTGYCFSFVHILLINPFLGRGLQEKSTWTWLKQTICRWCGWFDSGGFREVWYFLFLRQHRDGVSSSKYTLVWDLVASWIAVACVKSIKRTNLPVSGTRRTGGLGVDVWFEQHLFVSLLFLDEYHWVLEMCWHPAGIWYCSSLVVLSNGW